MIGIYYPVKLSIIRHLITGGGTWARLRRWASGRSARDLGFYKIKLDEI
jgi:hypothetical protein